MKITKEEYQSFIEVANNEKFMNFLKRKYSEYALTTCALAGKNTNEYAIFAGRALELMDLERDINNARTVLDKWSK